MTKIRPLSKELQKEAIKQLNEVPERLPADLTALREWIQQQPHLNSRTDDQFLLAFLRGCKFSLEKAKSKIDKYNAMRTKYASVFRCDNVDDAKLREILRLGSIIYLPTPLHGNGPRIGIMRMGVCPVENYNIEEVFRLSCALSEITMLEDDYAVVHGVVFIMDMANSTMAHLFQMSPSIAKKMTAFSEEAMPFRPKASHFVNTPAGAEPIFNMIKPMMSKKQQDRLYIHGDKLDLLHKQIPKKYLPKEYGGENGTVDEIIAYWDKKLDEYKDYFQENASYGTNESLRPGKPIDYENLFGIDGSFRKLDVD